MRVCLFCRWDAAVEMGDFQDFHFCLGTSLGEVKSGCEVSQVFVALAWVTRGVLPSMLPYFANSFASNWVGFIFNAFRNLSYNPTDPKKTPCCRNTRFRYNHKYSIFVINILVINCLFQSSCNFHVIWRVFPRISTYFRSIIQEVWSLPKAQAGIHSIIQPCMRWLSKGH